jgi:WD40 repeat protein
MLASGSGTFDVLRDTTVRLWRVSDGALLRTLQGPTDMVESVAFSPDGTIVASGSKDNAARLWRVSDGTLLRTLEGVGSNIALSPDGATLAEGGGSRVILWDVGTGQQLRTLPGAQPNVAMNSVAFAPGGQTLASGWADGKVRLWRVADGALLHVLEGHTDSVNSIAFSPDGVTLASASEDQTVRLWRVSDGTLLRTVAELQYPKSVAFSPDGALLAIAAGGNVFLRDVESGKQLRSLEYHEATLWIKSVAFSPDGMMLASGWADGTIVLWSLGQ